MDNAARYGRKRDVSRDKTKTARKQATKKDGIKGKWQTKKNNL